VNGFSAAISGVGSAVGRYFSIVSFIPSLFLAGFTFTLIESGAWSGGAEPDWAKAGNALTHLGNLALLTLISIALGVAVHPIQFALVQFFEGYWGTGSLAQRARVARILHHRRRLGALQFGSNLDAQVALDEKGATLTLKARVEHLSIMEESQRLIDGYPVDDDDIMPTRLGNVLRRYETMAGAQYELGAVEIIRHVTLVAPSQRVEYLNDQRQLLDLSVRMSATSIFAAFIAIAFLWHHGPWLLIALAPYAIAYLSYRGAIIVAHEYGAAVSTMIDLDRFALYDYLRLRRPKNTKAERRMNVQLMQLLSHNSRIVLPYEHPNAPGGSDTQFKGP
jgi:hypothetical protein